MNANKAMALLFSTLAAAGPTENRDTRPCYPYPTGYSKAERMEFVAKRRRAKRQRLKRQAA